MGMAHLRLPEPYDFELSTSRFRRWGVDRANLWDDGALWRAVDGRGVRRAPAGRGGARWVGGREVRIGPADGGGDVEPLDAHTAAVVRKVLGAEFDLDEFAAF